MRGYLLTAALMLALTSAAQASPVTQFCGDRVCGSPQAGPPDANGNRTARRSVTRSDVETIPNPPGCSRTRNSCACRLAAAWGLGGGLDATKTWLQRFARASGPGARVAAYRPGHIFGIVGAEGDGYRVVDYNSGRHRNHTYVLSEAQLRRYTLLDTRTRLAHNGR